MMRFSNLITYWFLINFIYKVSLKYKLLNNTAVKFKNSHQMDLIL